MWGRKPLEVLFNNIKACISFSIEVNMQCNLNTVDTFSSYKLSGQSLRPYIISITGPPDSSTASAPPIWIISAQDTSGHLFLTLFNISTALDNPAFPRKLSSCLKRMDPTHEFSINIDNRLDITIDATTCRPCLYRLIIGNLSVKAFTTLIHFGKKSYRIRPSKT